MDRGGGVLPPQIRGTRLTACLGKGNSLFQEPAGRNHGVWGRTGSMRQSLRGFTAGGLYSGPGSGSGPSLLGCSSSVQQHHATEQSISLP